MVSDSKKTDVSKEEDDFFRDAITKAISQKGQNVYQSFKIMNVEKKVKDGSPYAIVDFKYELLTGAGFQVDRRGVASVGSAGSSVQVLWTAATTARYKKVGDNLRTIAESFRVYSGGISAAA